MFFKVPEEHPYVAAGNLCPAATINSYLDYFTVPPLSLLEISG
jgi:hypothetical protein